MRGLPMCPGTAVARHSHTRTPNRLRTLNCTKYKRSTGSEGSRDQHHTWFRHHSRAPCFWCPCPMRQLLVYKMRVLHVARFLQTPTTYIRLVSSKLR